MAEFIGLGTELRIGDGAVGTEVFTLIGKVRNIDWTGRAVPAVRTTSMESGAETFIGGILDGGEVSGELNYIPADVEQEQLETDFEARTLRNFELEMADGTTTVTYTFAAIITELGTAVPLDDVVTRSFSLKVSGLVTEAQTP